MAASRSPPIGFDHATADPSPATGANSDAGRCECHDCEYAVPIDADLPPKCPECGGALIRVRS